MMKNEKLREKNRFKSIFMNTNRASQKKMNKKKKQQEMNRKVLISNYI